MKLFLEEIDPIDLEDGTSEEYAKELEKIKDNNEKELDKYIDSVNKTIDDVNSGDETVYVKTLTEKIELPEEDLEDEEVLDEALPKPLANAMKGQRSVGNKYIKTKLGKGRHNVNDYYQRINDGNPNIDFENSEYVEITPDEAIKYRKNGRVKDIMIIYGGRLITFNADGKQVYRAERVSDDRTDYPNLFRRPNGEQVDSTTKLTFNTIVNSADHIYLKEKEVQKDSDLLNSRRQNPMSKFSNVGTWPYNRETSLPTRGVYGTYDSSSEGRIRGGQDNPFRSSYYDSRQADNYAKSSRRTERKAMDYQHQIDELTGRIKELRSKMESDYDATDEDILEYKKQYKLMMGNLSDLTSWRDSTKNDAKRYYDISKEYLRNTRDARARFRYADSEMNLESPYFKVKDLKDKISAIGRQIRDANNRKAEIQDTGAPQRNKLNNALNVYKNRLADILSKIAELEKELQELPEDSAEIEAINQELSGYEATLAETQAELNKALKRKVVEEDLGDGTSTDFSDYEPEGPAAETYEIIANAGMLDNLENLFKELYPEGINFTQMNDILWLEKDFILSELGLSNEADGYEDEYTEGDDEEPEAEEPSEDEEDFEDEKEEDFEDDGEEEE